jgi:hypothetical protein
MKHKTLLLGLLCALLITSALSAERFEVERQTDKVTVKLDGELFTEYLIKSGAKPILWPIIGPTGDPVTRGFPMRDATPDERQDHKHHRSFWFTHGAVNDTDFWLEGGDRGGNIVHREFGKVEGGNTAVIETKNDWIDRHGKTVCRDERTLTFGVDGETRYIDFDITIKAAEEPVTFGDTKEGSFGVRVAGSMKVEAENGGTIVNSEGQKNANAWGKQASWVDYSGPVGENDDIVGIAILNHPKSFRYPSYWHVRTYGLFAANVFGLHHFLGDNSIDASHTLKPGDSMTFHYRVLIHDGDEQIGKVAEAFERYSEK